MSEPTPPPERAPQSGGPYLLDPRPSRHRERSRRLITRAADLATPDRAALLGAGECDEIPLEEMVARFKQITLNDLETAPLERALGQAHLDAAARATLAICIADLTGVTDSLLTGIQKAIVEETTAAEAIEAMATVVEHPPEHEFPRPLRGPFDLVVASCVLSQLHFALVHRGAALFEQKFSGQIETLRASPRWAGAVYALARTMETNFMTDLAGITLPGGVVYLSESVQMCYLRAAPDGKWQSEGTYRMLRSTELADYLDQRFEVIARDRWDWVVSPPTIETPTGRLYDVQAIVARRSE
ncbi:MAG TPA: hypothetical protein VHV08_07150 [Pirellulales bacterium]|nr:hypothetical protein [Pirellulales bacterium]